MIDGATYVVGGIGTARALIVGNNLFSNFRFEVDLSGVVVLSGATVLRAYSPLAHHGDYVCQITFTGAGQKVGFLFPLADPSYKHYAATAILKSTCALRLSIVDDLLRGGSTVVSQAVITEYTPVSVSQVFSNVFGAQYVQFVITSDAAGVVLVDSIECFEVSRVLDLSQAQAEGGDYEKVYGAQNRMRSGVKKNFFQGWRPSYTLVYEILTVEEESIRSALSEDVQFLFYPHNDNPFVFLGYCPKDYDRAYAFNKFIGHTGELFVRGKELLPNKGAQ